MHPAGASDRHLELAFASRSALRGPLQYSWHKDGQPLPRAVRPRLVLTGTGDAEGVYSCLVTCGEASVTAGPCSVRLSREAKAKATERVVQRQRFESPLRRAAGAVQMGDVKRAVELLSEACVTQGL